MESLEVTVPLAYITDDSRLKVGRTTKGPPFPPPRSEKSSCSSTTYVKYFFVIACYTGKCTFI